MIGHPGRVIGAVLATGVLLAATGCTLGIPKNLPQYGTSTHTPAPLGSNGPLTVGVDLSVVPGKSTADQIISWGKRDIAYIANTLHVQSVGIDFPLVVPEEHADTIEATTFATPTVDEVKQLTHIAHTYHLQVQYRVLFRIHSKHRLSPANRDTWFANLLAVETPYLQAAQGYGVNQFIVGTEQAPIEHDTHWGQFEAQAAKIYHGTISYAMWGGEPDQGGVFWGQGCSMPFKQCGITFYPKMSLPQTASVSQIAQVMQSDLNRLDPKVLEHMAIDELGIPAVDGAFQHPWDWTMSGKQDDNVQANWLSAACQAAHAVGIQGLWLWWMPIESDPASTPAATEFAGRAASVKAIQTCAQVTAKAKAT